MSQSKAKSRSGEPDLFPDEPRLSRSALRKFKQIKQAAWTHHKAVLIQQYIKLFVQVTKHGTYIDGFAGPQRHKQLESWSAKLVVETQPRWLREFHLCELNPVSSALIADMIRKQAVIDAQGRPLNRSIFKYQGDFNEHINAILPRCNNERTATFCLLDQRTFECHWQTVEKLARFKRKGFMKVEIFYFLAVHWLHRAMSAVSQQKAEKWWGKTDWERLRKLSRDEIRDEFVARFKDELGYQYVYAYPVFAEERGEIVMYYMIHASDHPDAPTLMDRAYRKAVRAKKADQPRLSLSP